MKIRCGASAVSALTLFLAMPTGAQTPASLPPFVQEATFEDPGHAPIKATIFAPATGSTLPLIVMSHGTGAAMMSHSDTARALAQAGFVVIAPLHPEDNFQNDTAAGTPRWLVDRVRHVSRAIDYMTRRWPGRVRLAPGAVGLFGFSAGGTTALISIGGEPNLAGVAAHCARRPEYVCKIMSPVEASGVAAPVWTHDSRVDAAVIVAPSLGFAFAPTGLAKVKVPIQIWVGDADTMVPTETNAAIIRSRLARSVEFHLVPGAGHLSFLEPCGPDSPPFLCKEKPGFDRSAFHRTFNGSIISFFRNHLKSTIEE